MKNREEYIESIYRKRDEALKLRKKRRSYLTAAACIAVCFLTAFFLVPQDKPKIEETPDYSLDNSNDRFIYETTPEDFASLPSDNGTADGAEKAEGCLREDKTTAPFGAIYNEETVNTQSCTVATSVPQQSISSATTKAAKTTTKKNPSKNNTDKNDIVGAGDSIIDVEDVIDGLDYILSDSIKLPEFTMSGNLLQGFHPEGFGGSLGYVPPVTPETPPAPDTGSDDYTGVLNVAHSYLSDNELKEIDSKKTEISLQDSPLDSTTGSSLDTYVYYVVFQTDTKTIIIILDADTLKFLGREEHSIAETTTAPQTTTPESATAPKTTAESETTTVTQPATVNN